jgi:hypothetical protein
MECVALREWTRTHQKVIRAVSYAIQEIMPLRELVHLTSFEPESNGRKWWRSKSLVNFRVPECERPFAQHVSILLSLSCEQLSAPRGFGLMRRGSGRLHEPGGKGLYAMLRAYLRVEEPS